MKAIVARCGFRCDLCPAFFKNSRTAADRLAASAGWSRYFHLHVKPEAMRCNGCFAAPRADRTFPDKKCSIRRCVTERELGNCAACKAYPCVELEQRMKRVEKVIRRFQKKIARKEFDRFIAPYDARKTLNRLAHRHT